MRRKLIEADLVDCVLGLGPNLFFNSPMEACVVLCRTCKPPQHQDRILFIDALQAITRERAYSFLRPEHQQRIADAYQAFAEVPGFAAVATRAAVAATDYSLSIPLYVKRGKLGNDAAPDGRRLAAVWASWEQNGEVFWKQMDTLVATLDGLSD
jgi:type I restriction enzyme M protein